MDCFTSQGSAAWLPSHDIAPSGGEPEKVDSFLQGKSELEVTASQLFWSSAPFIAAKLAFPCSRSIWTLESAGQPAYRKVHHNRGMRSGRAESTLDNVP